MRFMKGDISGKPTRPHMQIEGRNEDVRRIYYRKGDKYVSLPLFLHEESNTIIVDADKVRKEVKYEQ